MLETILLAAGIPSAIMGFIVWYLQHKITLRDAERDRERQEQEKRAEQREKNIEKLMLMMMNTGRATNVLAEATARAVQRIPEAHCNGDMTAALELAAKYQKEEKDFLLNQGIQNIFGEEN